MVYDFFKIEQKWQHYWAKNKTFKAKNNSKKPKFYILDMFPYPSGSGLHVGHPLGYIASDIFSRYKRLKGFNVLHPMGYDAFGLPAEQYAIQTGKHPEKTTNENISKYRKQLDKMGFSYDWDREVKTCDPNYYRWTQWIFIQLFNSYYCNIKDKALPLSNLIEKFKKNGNAKVKSPCNEDTPAFTAKEWNSWDIPRQQKTLMNYRLAFLAETRVNWCPKLGTVLANEEVRDGLSERGGYLVERKKMKQWCLRITAYADRLLNDLNELDWTDALKEQQKNWIGKSVGANISFHIENSNEKIDVFTTRPDTIFGVSFIAVAPEHGLLKKLTIPKKKEEIDAYVKKAQSRSERDRISDTKTISGKFTGSFVLHPFTNKKIPVWVADYVLSGYGTGAIMAVPAHDSRDYNFAKHFNLTIIEVVKGGNINECAYEKQTGILFNSSFANNLSVKKAQEKIISELERRGAGKQATSYKIRNAIFSRQRYWGEPFPIYYDNDVPLVLDEKELPLKLPNIKEYKPTGSGEPPLARAKKWTFKKNPLETSTMPGWAGSSWYFLRYMDAQNSKEFLSKEREKYWQDVDLYIGGSEHATGHLLYSRFWQKFLFDAGFVCKKEPFKKLINQGMILGRSNIVYKLKKENTFVSFGLKNKYETTPIHVDISIVDNDILDIKKFKEWRQDFHNASFILEGNQYICGVEVEKMSKSLFNVVNPDNIINKYGADTLRLYEMFLGPLDQSKPWNTNGIEGVHKFLKKTWRLFHSNKTFSVSEKKASAEELKILHKTIKKTTEDIERFAFNTAVSNFMICINELTALKCNKKEVLTPLIIVLAPFAPHLCEEIWEKLGNNSSISFANFPHFNSSYLIENTFDYPITFNGKMKFKITLSLSLSATEIEQKVLENKQTQHYLIGKKIKKVIVVHKRIVNIVI